MWHSGSAILLQFPSDPLGLVNHASHSSDATLVVERSKLCIDGLKVLNRGALLKVFHSCACPYHTYIRTDHIMLSIHITRRPGGKIVSLHCNMHCGHHILERLVIFWCTPKHREHLDICSLPSSETARSMATNLSCCCGISAIAASCLLIVCPLLAYIVLRRCLSCSYHELN